MTRTIPIVIGGDREPVSGRSLLPVTSPSTGERLADLVLAESEDVDRAIAAARQAVPGTAAMSYRQRGALLVRVAELVADRSSDVARDLASEQGKPLAEAQGEVDIAVEMWREAAELIRHWTEEILPSDDPSTQVHVTRRPHGVLRW